MNFTLDIELYDENNKCKIRSVYLEDKGLIFSVADFVNLCCFRDINDKYGKNFSSENQYQKVSGYCFLFQFTGERQRKTPVTNIRGLQKILLILPGETGNKYRNLSESTISRIISGDQSLHDIIDENYKSKDFLNETMRDTLNKDPINEEDKIESILRGKIDKLKIKNNDLKLEIKDNRIALRNKDNIIEKKDNIIDETRIDLRNKDLTINTLTNINDQLNTRNNVLSNRNISLINNYAHIPGEDLVEYLTILRKNRIDYIYNDREKNENETTNAYITETYKHYIIRCQYRSIQSLINNFKNNYVSPDAFVIYQDRNGNPGTLTHLLKNQNFIANHIGNEIKVIDEVTLINYLNNYRNTI
jgi:hypothetical protein